MSHFLSLMQRPNYTGFGSLVRLCFSYKHKAEGLVIFNLTRDSCKWSALYHPLNNASAVFIRKNTGVAVI